MHVPSIAWDLFVPKSIHCLSEIQSELGFLNFYLLSLATLLVVIF